jgi:phospholipid/cholesterol/gamma-HCH transport system substrate-binding protein
MRRTRQRGPGPFTTGLLVLVLVAIGTYFGFTKSIPFRHHYTVGAVFTTANNVRPGSPVRIAGVNVGKVVSVDHTGKGDQAATVRMRIDQKGLPLHRDAQFAIRPRIFLEGNFFVDVKPGSPSAPVLRDGDTVPVNQTHAPVQLDQVLTSLQTATRADLQRLLRELSTGLSGPGARGFNRSIPFWKAAYENSAIVSDATLGETPHDLSGYLRGAQRVADALDRSPGQLRDLVTSFNATAGAFAAQDTALSQAVAELPRTLRAGRPALAALNAAFPPLRRLVRDLRPAVHSSGPTLDASLPFVRQARGLVQDAELRGLARDLRPTVPSLAALQDASIPLLQQVRPASSCQNDVILPWTHDTIQDQTFPAVGPVYVESTKPFGGLAAESRSGDANGQWFRVMVSPGDYATPTGANRFLMTSSPLLGVNPPPPLTKTPFRPDVPCETQQQPDLRSTPGQLPQAQKVTPADTPTARAILQHFRDLDAKTLTHVLKATKADGQQGSVLRSAIDKLSGGGPR